MFHEPTGWLKALAAQKVASSVVTRPVFQVSGASLRPGADPLLNTHASLNIVAIVVTLEVSHVVRFWLKALANLNVSLMVVTNDVFHDARG
ncbi:unannotated protein [freshwater metagenome]|uniref:Unannotated protein n=1 Tax=freshwater metagenome TaxID=449393 RepID=A0A6J7KAL8_9ZZZZ